MALATYTQAGRPLAVTTPLGADVLLLIAMRGQETISRPFQYELDLVAPNRTEIAFERLVGQRMTVELRGPRGAPRFFHGRVNRFSQGPSDSDFTHYQAELVPDLWLLTKIRRSRIFQHVSVLDILRKVLEGLDVSYQLQGQFPPRDFCVQYRESDFDFASRLMEEEGIYYFFVHNERGHQLVLANAPQSHPDVPPTGTAPFAHAHAGGWPEECVTSWRKVQELRSGKYELRDYCFELPRTHLEAQRRIQDDVPVGRVNHKLTAGLNGKHEIYDYPGGYAQRFDGIDRGGGEHPEDLQKIFEDNQRTVGIRMQQEAAPGLTIYGAGTCRQFLPGHKFTLTGHGHGDGAYVLTDVRHDARQPGYASGDASNGFAYQNSFTCIPVALPYRPAQQTPRSMVHGTQTATVVGLAGQEIFVDKYGRVKVQFHWDREGKNDADSSCWVRVAQPWASKGYGAFFWPRAGDEVVVAFEEGDPDRPMIIGSVYNAENRAPYDMPKDRDMYGIITQSTPGGTPDEYNELSFKDTKGEELVYMRAQKDFTREVLHDDALLVGNEQTIEIKKGRKATIAQGNDETTVEDGHATKTVSGNIEFECGKYVKLHGKSGINLRSGDSQIEINPMGVFIQAPRIHMFAPSIELEADRAIVLDADLVFLNSPVTMAHQIDTPVLITETVISTSFTWDPLESTCRHASLSIL